MNGPSETKPQNQIQRTTNCSSKCAYDCAQLQYTIQHGTVLIISPLTSRQPVSWTTAVGFRIRLKDKADRLERRLARQQLPSSRQDAKSPGCAWPLQLPSPFSGCRINSTIWCWHTAMSTTLWRSMIPLKLWPISTRARIRSYTHSCGDLFASRLSR